MNLKLKTLSRKILLSILSLIISLFTFSQTASSIIGKWKSEDADKDMQMEIYLATDGNYYGKIINGISKSSKTGKLTIKKLRYSADEKKYTGTMEPPDMSITLNITVTMESLNRLKIVAKKLLVSKTTYLSRIQ